MRNFFYIPGQILLQMRYRDVSNGTQNFVSSRHWWSGMSTPTPISLYETWLNLPPRKYVMVRPLTDFHSFTDFTLRIVLSLTRNTRGLPRVCKYIFIGVLVLTCLSTDINVSHLRKYLTAINISSTAFCHKSCVSPCDTTVSYHYINWRNVYTNSSDNVLITCSDSVFGQRSRVNVVHLTPCYFLSCAVERILAIAFGSYQGYQRDFSGGWK